MLDVCTGIPAAYSQHGGMLVVKPQQRTAALKNNTCAPSHELSQTMMTHATRHLSEPVYSPQSVQEGRDPGLVYQRTCTSLVVSGLPEPSIRHWPGSSSGEALQPPALPRHQQTGKHHTCRCDSKTAFTSRCLGTVCACAGSTANSL